MTLTRARWLGRVSEDREEVQVGAGHVVVRAELAFHLKCSQNASQSRKQGRHGLIYALKATKNLILCISMYHKGEKRDLNKESFQTFYLILIKVQEKQVISHITLLLVRKLRLLRSQS